VNSLRVVCALWLASLLSLRCSERVDVGFDHARGGSAGAPFGGGVGMRGGNGGVGGSSGSSFVCVPAQCQGKGYDCGDCQDNDGDGLIDALDPDCLGACDNSEDSYFPNIPGQNNAPCKQDCYFDKDSGSGNDGCDWTHACDELSSAPEFYPSGDAQCRYDADAQATCASLSQQPEQCLNYCLPLVPNGCDCFGCCEAPAHSNRFVYLGSTTDGVGSCDSAHVDDEARCHPCTPVSSCFNSCEGCEVCVGETRLSGECGGETPRCDVGVSPCGPDLPCSGLTYCVTGCCIEVPR